MKGVGWIALLIGAVYSFSPSITTCHGHQRQDAVQLAAGNDKGPLEFLFNPYESNIPKELEKQIYEAEARTEAAKDRSTRIALYTVLAILGFMGGFFNFFLSELRGSVPPEGSDPFELSTSMFSWVESFFLFNFLFTNKIGGFACLLFGGASGLLAEAELDTKRINAEKIFSEMQRRREERESKPKRKASKKRLSGKERKRMNALSEVAQLETKSEPKVESSKPSATTSEQVVEEAIAEAPPSPEKKADDGVLGKIKGFYERADNMAATQALLLNKKLEEEGILDKITDESGLKVIGKEAAAKQAHESKQSSDKEKQ